MSIPNTAGGWGMRDVCDEMGLSYAGRTLTSLFSSANNDGFDPNYVGNKDRLSNFRNYTHVPFTPSLSISPTSETINSDAQSFNITVTSNTGWTVSDSAIWLSVDPISGSGNGTITVTATGNTSSLVRDATISVSPLGLPDRTCEVTQLPQENPIIRIDLRGIYASNLQACNATEPLQIFYISGGSTWISATHLWKNASGTVPADPGFYSNLTSAGVVRSVSPSGFINPSSHVCTL